jgi:hypothetical protein
LVVLFGDGVGKDLFAHMAAYVTPKRAGKKGPAKTGREQRPMSSFKSLQLRI